MERVWMRALLACGCALLLGVGVFASVGCGGSDGEGKSGGDKTTLVIWDQSSSRHEATQEIDKLFMKEHPNISIKREYYPFSQLSGLTKNALRTGSGPDMVYIDVTPARELFKAGLVIDLAQYSKKYDWAKRFNEVGLSWTTEGDSIFGLGLESEFFGMMYNKTLIAKAGLTVPRTIDEAVSFCKAARDKGYIPFAASGGGGGWQYEFYTSFSMVNAVGPAAQRGLAVDKKGSWDTPETQRAMDGFFTRMKDADCFPPNLNGVEPTATINLVTGGKALIGVPWGPAFIEDLVKAKTDYEWGIAPWPAPDAGKEGYYIAGIGSTFVIGAQSKHKDAAAELLDFWFSPTATKLLIEKRSIMPPVRFDPNSLDVTPVFKDALKILSTADMGIAPNIVCPSKYFDVVTKGGQAVYDGKASVSKLLNDMQDACRS